MSSHDESAYDCSNCPGYCCSYPVIAVTDEDLARLAEHFGLTLEVARRKFTKNDHGQTQIMRRKSDPIYGRICRFFDTRARKCTAYLARPAICRTFPGEGRCGYYDFLSFERQSQGDPDHIALTNSGNWR
ncbi:MAG: YkgJ family cysteine cluster protein [Hyphomicrobiaceae bacterium]